VYIVEPIFKLRHEDILRVLFSGNVDSVDLEATKKKRNEKTITNNKAGVLNIS